MTKTIIFAALLALCFAFSLWLNVSLSRDKKELETALSVSQERVEQLKADIQRQSEVLFEREKKISSLANEKYKLSKKLKEAAEHEQEVKLWIDTRVPDSVSGMLKDNGTTDNTATASSPMQ